MDLVGKYCDDCKVFTSNIEEDAVTMIYSILNNKEFSGSKIRIMPDVHLGKGIVIGFSAPITNSINPSHVGVDIGCAVTLCITNTKIDDVDLKLIEHRVKKSIPMGTNIHNKRIYEMKDFIKFMKSEYNKARSTWGEMINDFDVSENGFSSLLKRIKMDEKMFYKSIGTLGSGNHFLEFGNYNGNLTFSVHCGSRNFGYKVCHYWETIASSNQVDNKLLKEEVNKLKKIVKDKRELPRLISELKAEMESKVCSNGYLSGDNMRGYITDMVIAQAYAKYNHKMICEIICDILRKTNNSKVIDVIQSIHNYIDMEDHIIRKGAIRSYVGEKIIIPLNMRDGIVLGYGKSNDDWNCTAPHGGGRRLSRSKAKNELSMEEFEKSMEGIYTTSVCKNTLDESPMAYKDSNEIISLIEPTCEIIDIVRPIINIKSTEIEKSW